MKLSSSYEAFVDEVLDDKIVDLESKYKIKCQIVNERISREEAIRRNLTIGYGLLILILFIISYGILIFALHAVFYSELSLIEKQLLDAKDRSVNATAVAALIAGTVTQTGFAFYLVTRHLFALNKEQKLINSSDDTQNKKLSAVAWGINNSELFSHIVLVA